MGNYGITGWSGGSRQSLTYNLKAGQFRGMGRVNVFPSKTTIINNNIIGGGYGVYTDHHCCDNGTPKWMNWMMGIGMGTTLLGGILNMFGIGGGGGSVEGAGGKEPETTPNNNNQYKGIMDQMKEMQAQIDKLSDQLATGKPPAATPAPVTTPEQTPAPAAEEPETPDEPTTPQADYSNIANGKKMVCTDASGKTQDISGTLSNVQTDANGVPQSFTLTDDKSGNKYNYEVRVGSDGSLSYECVSKNGQTTIGAPNYSLKDGKLVNEQSQNGYGIGIRTSGTTQVSDISTQQTTNIEDDGNGNLVSDTETFMTPYKHSDGKYYSVEEQNPNQLFKTPWSNITE